MGWPARRQEDNLTASLPFDTETTMLRIARHTDYAARVVLFLACEPDGERRATAAEIARLRLIPRAFVRRVVSRLSTAGILTTTRGHRGGVALARPPSRINLLDVVRAMEGPPSFSECIERASACALHDGCQLTSCFREANRALEKVLVRTHFGDLAARAARRALGGRRRRRDPRS